MNLNKMREFIEFTGYMNFTTAAKSMHMSQPSLSKHIRDIESEIGVSLVVRRGVGEENILTPAGQVFLERTQTLLKDYNDIVLECQSTERMAPKAFIHSLVTSTNINAQIQQALQKDGTGNSLDLFTIKEIDNNICDALDRDDIDFAVHFEPHKEMRAFAGKDSQELYGWIPFAPERLCFFMKASHPLAHKKPLLLEDLKPYEIISGQSASYKSWYFTLTQLLAEHGFALNLKLLVDDPRRGQGLSLEDNRVCLSSEQCAKLHKGMLTEEVVIRQIEDLDSPAFPFLVFRKDNTNPHVQRIISSFNGMIA